MTQMQRWEPLPVGTHTHDSNIDGRIVITISADGEYIGVVGSEEGDREYVNLYPPGKYRLCRLVPAAEVGVLVTYDQLISMQMAMLVAWEGVKGTVQSDQTVARLQQLDNQIGAWLAQMKGE